MLRKQWVCGKWCSDSWPQQANFICSCIKIKQIRHGRQAIRCNRHCSTHTAKWRSLNMKSLERSLSTSHESSCCEEKQISPIENHNAKEFTSRVWHCSTCKIHIDDFWIHNATGSIDKVPPFPHKQFMCNEAHSRCVKARVACFENILLIQQMLTCIANLDSQARCR